MSTCCCHFKGALGSFLALDIRHVGEGHVIGLALGFGAGEDLRALHMIDELDERLGGQNIEIVACPGGFTAGGLGADKAEIIGVGGHGGGQGTCNGEDRSIQCKFTQHGIAPQKIRGDHA